MNQKLSKDKQAYFAAKRDIKIAAKQQEQLLLSAVQKLNNKIGNVSTIIKEDINKSNDDLIKSINKDIAEINKAINSLQSDSQNKISNASKEIENVKKSIPLLKPVEQKLDSLEKDIKAITIPDLTEIKEELAALQSFVQNYTPISTEQIEERLDKLESKNKEKLKQELQVLKINTPGGNVSGPDSSGDNAIARFDGTTGKIIQNSVVTLDDTGNIEDVNAIKFNLTPTNGFQEGDLFWDEDTGTLAIQYPGGVVKHEIGQGIDERVKNVSGGTILNGQAVVIVGNTNGRANVDLADNTTIGDNFVYGIATEDIPNNQQGYITTIGLVNEVDTSSYSFNDLLYLGTSGNLTNVKPTAPNAKIAIGQVIKSHATEGVIYVHVDHRQTLDNISDVEISTVADQDILQYDLSLQTWQNIKPVTVETKTGDYTITGSEANEVVILADASSGAITITLPTAASTPNRKITIKKIDSSVNTVTIDGNTSETIDGELDAIITEPKRGACVISNSTEWNIISLF